LTSHQRDNTPHEHGSHGTDSHRLHDQDHSSGHADHHREFDRTSHTLHGPETRYDESDATESASEPGVIRHHWHHQSEESVDSIDDSSDDVDETDEMSADEIERDDRSENEQRQRPAGWGQRRGRRKNGRRNR
jgi:hypothetical protein